MISQEINFISIRNFYNLKLKKPLDSDKETTYEYRLNNSKIICNLRDHSFLIVSLVGTGCQLILIAMTASKRVCNKKCDNTDHSKGAHSKFKQLVVL